MVGDVCECGGEMELAMDVILDSESCTDGWCRCPAWGCTAWWP
jgi:hypothetical protein